MPQECNICKVIKDESEFSWLNRNKGVQGSKSCRECNSKKYEEKTRALESTYQHLWIREDGSKIADPWEIVDDRKRHTCDKCRKQNSVKEFVIYDSKYNSKLSKVCKICNDYRRKENKNAKEVSLKNNGTGMGI